MNSCVNETLFDALFARALAEDAAREAESAPDDAELAAAFPERARHRRLLRRYVRAEKKGKYTPAAVIWLKRAAVIILCAATVAFAAALTDVNVRGAIKKAIFSIFSDHLETVMEQPGGDHVDIYDFEIGYIPDGYVLTESYEDEQRRSYSYNYGIDFIDLTIRGNKETYLTFDNETPILEEITINGNDGYINYSPEPDAIDGRFYTTLFYFDHGVLIKMSTSCGKDETIKIAENIVIK